MLFLSYIFGLLPLLVGLEFDRPEINCADDNRINCLRAEHPLQTSQKDDIHLQWVKNKQQKTFKRFFMVSDCYSDMLCFEKPAFDFRTPFSCNLVALNDCFQRHPK